MFAVYINVTRVSHQFFIFYFFLYIFIFFFNFHLPTTYLSLIITNIFFNITIIGVLEKSSGGGEGVSKQGIQAAWSTPIHHVKWWRSRFRGVCRAYAASEVDLFVILTAFGPLYVTESSILGAVRVLHVFCHFIIIFVIIVIIVAVITIIINIIFITFIIIRLLGFLIKNSLLFLWGKLKVYVYFPQFLHVS